MSRSQISAIVYGWLTIACFMFVSSIMITLLTRFIHLSVDTMTLLTLIVGFLALFIGGMIGGVKGKENSLLIGVVLGLGFTTIILSMQLMMFGSFFEIYQLTYHLLFIVTAMIGAVIGVHLTSRQTEDA